MTNVVLKTEAEDFCAFDGMEITLNLRCEGLSMPASLRKLQESADQLLGSLQNLGIDPASFSMEDLESLSKDDEQKQCARLEMKAAGDCDLELLKRIWQCILSMPFATELSTSFYMKDEQAHFTALCQTALSKARAEAEAIGMQLGRFHPSCVSVEFIQEKRDGVQPSIQTCDPVDWTEGSYPKFLDQLKRPGAALKAIATTTWTFE